MTSNLWHQILNWQYQAKKHLKLQFYKHQDNLFENYYDLIYEDWNENHFTSSSTETKYII